MFAEAALASHLSPRVDESTILRGRANFHRVGGREGGERHPSLFFFSRSPAEEQFRLPPPPGAAVVIRERARVSSPEHSMFFARAPPYASLHSWDECPDKTGNGPGIASACETENVIRN